MTNRLIVLATFLFVAVPLASSSIIAHLTSPTQTGNPGDTLGFDLTLTNTSLTDQVWLNGVSSTAASPFLSVDSGPFFANAPFVIDPGSTTSIFRAFNVVIDPSAAAGPYIGSFVSILGGPDGGAGTTFADLVDIQFDVDVTSSTALATPEPGTFAIVALPLLLLFVKKRWGLTLAALALVGNAQGAKIKTVHFASEDYKTTLVGYLFEPQTAGPHPAIVLLHGRAGPYSSLANGVYDAGTLSKRHKAWGNFWADRGYYALLVDSFGPRGYPAGFPRFSYSDRPPEVSEQTVRPLDAYGALRYLRKYDGVIPDRVGVQGWSNGAMTVLATMSDHAPGKLESGFAAALAEYPGCGMDATKGEYRSYAPMLILLAEDDEEVNPKICQKFAERAKAEGDPLEWHVYPGASHNYDDPGPKTQSVPANRAATEDTFRRAEAFFTRLLNQ